ncbi:MAG TPA: hypothetical protein VN924_00745 [Bryobacteraceae bacterium]|nr:hypothetical protein [Bryobacteraceae bacterium]
MLSGQSFLLIVLGFAFAIAAALARSYMWGRLREAAVPVPRWWTVADDIRAGEKYLHLARTKTVPLWPLILTAAGLPAGFLLMVAAIFRR